jgi:LysR family transcriptional regulator, transcriptional activator of nhaA
MDWLNYHHLRYFWAVAREGGLRGAAEKLNVSQPSISAQVRLLEESLGEPLFRRGGRGLSMTETGRLVYEYADEIFTAGRELMAAVRTKAPRGATPFHVGITDGVPKLAAREMLRPVLTLDPPARLICREGHLDELLGALAAHRLDLVLADEAAPSMVKFKTFNHPLGSCSVTFCARPKLAARLRPGFPGSLQGAPALLPTEQTPLRMAVERWLEAKEVRPRAIAEFDDPALMKAFALDFDGVFPLHSITLREAGRHYGFKTVGEAVECRTQFFAITADRRIRHPAVIAVTEHAHRELFA